VSGVRAALLRWYRRHRRDLPWRRTRDPYAIWVSEAMLQQTRVETVVPYYERFLRRFPDVASLADAELDDVMCAWEGLGYYSRARRLKHAAEMVMDRFGGRVPSQADELQSLPGIGRYTAGAIASIAFGRAEPVLDGNVTRVLARLHGIRDSVDQPKVVERLWQEATRLARGSSPGDLNQALMELGARVCTPKSPGCETCPIQRWCQAAEAGDPEAIPRKTRRPEPRLLRVGAALLLRRGRALAVKRPAGGLLGGLWELPGTELTGKSRPERAVTSALEAAIGLPIENLERLGQVDHLFSHRRLELLVFRGSPGAGRLRLDGYTAHRWVSPAGLGGLPHGRATRKALELALATR
jgi:A/G-specific adenine glycosylase